MANWFNSANINARQLATSGELFELAKIVALSPIVAGVFMRGRIGGMYTFWLWIAFLLFYSAAGWYGFIQNLRTGESNVKGKCYKRAEQPFEFWFDTGFCLVAALFAIGCVICFLFGGNLDWHTGLWKQN